MIERYLIWFLMLVSLTACAGASSPGRHNCSKGGEVCIEVRAKEPIMWGEPVTIVVTVTSEKDFPELGIYLTTYPNSIVVQEAIDEEPGKVTRKDQSWVNWLVDIKGGQPVSFIRKLSLPPEEGTFRIQASAAISNLRAVDSMRIYLTREGGKAYLSDTPIPITPGSLPTMNPDDRATASVWPSATPYPTMPPVPTTEAPPPEVLGTPAYPPPETPPATPTSQPYP